MVEIRIENVGGMKDWISGKREREGEGRQRKERLRRVYQSRIKDDIHYCLQYGGEESRYERQLKIEKCEQERAGGTENK